MALLPAAQSAIKEALQTSGAYEVAKFLSELSSETSREYMEAGNDGAIIHRDAEVLNRAVKEMRNSHFLRS